MKLRPASILIFSLLLLTALTACLHLSSRTEIPPGEALVFANGHKQTIRFEDLPAKHIDGEIRSAKNETLRVTGSGIALADALAHAGIRPEELNSLTVVASDEYRAELTGDEVRAPDKVWLLLQEDGGLRLIVFGDPDSRRNVSNVVRMEAK